ncbi:MAG: flagellar hook-basal body complex protein FliE [Spirochaetaceae bacterium]|nr:flagellar hook-basal body complex protein FliE [Spirochaetaceae bacterium]
MLPINVGPAAGDIVRLARTNPMHYTANGLVGAPVGKAEGDSGGSSFENAMLKAMDGVNAYQNQSSDLVQQMAVDPDSVDAHDVTVAMAEANLSLNIARTIMDRVVRGWKEVINTR